MAESTPNANTGTATLVKNGGVATRAFLITAKDTDTSVVIEHGIRVGKPEELEVYVTPLAAAYHRAQWYVAAVTDTTVTLNKLAEAGSGSEQPQARVTIQLPSSLIR